MKECERYLEDLGLLVADEIEAGPRATLLRHLEGCPDCARERALFEKAFADLRAGDAPDPGPVYWSGFENRFRTRLLARRALARRRLLVAAAAVLVATVALGMLMGRWPSGAGGEGALIASQAGSGASTAAPEAAASLRPSTSEGERAEARLEAALHSVRGLSTRDEEFEAILDEVAPGDPYAFTGVADVEPERSSGV